MLVKSAPRTRAIQANNSRSEGNERVSMTGYTFKFIACLFFGTALCSAQTLSPKWEELTSPDFTKAIKEADGVCLLPMGSIEKFGPSGPLGTNLLVDRIVVLEAVKQEYAVVFPEYIVAGTNDVSNLPGQLRTARTCSTKCWTRPPARWRATGARKS